MISPRVEDRPVTNEDALTNQIHVLSATVQNQVVEQPASNLEVISSQVVSSIFYLKHGISFPCA